MIFFPLKNLLQEWDLQNTGVILNHYFKTQMKFRLLKGDPVFPENCQVLLVDALKEVLMELWLLLFPHHLLFLCWPLRSSLALRIPVWKCTAETSCILLGLYGHIHDVDPIPEPSPLAAGCSYWNWKPSSQALVQLPSSSLHPPPPSSRLLLCFGALVCLSFFLIVFFLPAFLHFLF